ncbi:hypothetical protein C8R48DRAFT_782385 [Suillus tomentosus]|nr:hypothetical protein C8R48DRAFT_782385 [Suillus tomentosus]
MAPLETKAALIHRLFTESLLRANISAVELEQGQEFIHSCNAHSFFSSSFASDGRIISENEILVMAGPWVSTFMHDSRRVAFQTINHARAGFGLHDIFGTLLKARLEHLLSHFMRPQSSRLPFDQNGLVWIFRTRCIKSILWHTAFRVTISAAATVATTPGLPMIMADLEPAVFRHTSVLPVETLAFIESLLPYSLFVTASVLFGLVDYHDLTVLLEVSLGVVAKQIQLQQAETNPSVFPPQGGRCFMEERMHRAQTEISLFSTAIANLCELMNTRAIAPKLLPPVNTSYTGAYQTPSSLNCKRFQPTKETQDKCLAWLITSSPFQDTMEVGSDVSQITPESPRRHQYPLRHDDQLLSLPRLTNAWIDNVKLAPTHRYEQRVHAKGGQNTDELMSVFHILDLKKQRAQAEVDMFSEAIALNAELEFTDDGTSSGKATMYETHLHNDWFNDWFSTSSAPSDASDILQHSQL